MCNSSKQPDGAFKNESLTPDNDFDEYSALSDVGISIGSKTTSGIECTPNSTGGSLIHTLILSSGSSSQAQANSGFISHSVSLPAGQATSRGIVSTHSAMPSVPPSLIPCTISPVNDSPFTLAFFSGNILICRGCRQSHRHHPLIFVCVIKNGRSLLLLSVDLFLSVGMVTYITTAICHICNMCQFYSRPTRYSKDCSCSTSHPYCFYSEAHTGTSLILFNLFVVCVFCVIFCKIR